MNRRLALSTTILAAASLAAATALAGGKPSQQTRLDLRGLEGVEFVSVCRFSHRGPDDPIVFPRKPGLSHDHTFFGSVSTNAFSTARSIRASATTCQRAEDTAAYWAPTLLQENRPVDALDAEVYYRRRTVEKVRAFPPGLMIIGGDSGALRPQSRRVVFWDCGTTGGVGPAITPPTCPNTGSKSLRLNVRFPDCWDGEHVQSRNHHSHMAYSIRGACPASHPVALPSVELVVHYPVRGGRGVELASRGQLTGHADFVNAWQQPGLRRLVEYCLNALRNCGRGA